MFELNELFELFLLLLLPGLFLLLRILPSLATVLIEEVNRKMLEKLLEENDFVAVYFCKFYFILEYRKIFRICQSYLIFLSRTYFILNIVSQTLM